MNKRWQVIVEITFDPTKVDEEPGAALTRVKAALDTMLLKDRPDINHYHILQPPKYVHEFD